MSRFFMVHCVHEHLCHLYIDKRAGRKWMHNFIQSSKRRCVMDMVSNK